MKKVSLRLITTAAALTGALMLGAQAQAQTGTSPVPSNAAGMNAATPDGPNSRPKTMMERDAAKGSMSEKSGAAIPTNEAGMNTPIPAGPDARPTTMQQRDAANPGKSGTAVPTNEAGMNTPIPAGPATR